MDDYTVVEENSAIVLRNIVLGYLRIGWYCQGGVSISVGPSGTKRYCQALMKRIGG